ncbi:hypothetical protein [Empedobacter sp.]|uniref:hypothetical protein n=1 Tax=Empedobacter sp. TaxID=1927715 RepID=UPI0028976248|nr:hypothetical protein [Empedobacter sp.]
MTTKEKVLQYLDVKGISKGDFYKKTGFSNGFLTAGKHIGSDNLKIIIDNYPDLSLEWLVMDKGDMIIGDKNLNNPMSNDFIEMQKMLLKYKDDEIERLKSEIENLKKSIATSPYYERIVAEPIKQLTKEDNKK